MKPAFALRRRTGLQIIRYGWRRKQSFIFPQSHYVEFCPLDLCCAFRFFFLDHFDLTWNPLFPALSHHHCIYIYSVLHPFLLRHQWVDVHHTCPPQHFHWRAHQDSDNCCDFCLICRQCDLLSFWILPCLPLLHQDRISWIPASASTGLNFSSHSLLGASTYRPSSSYQQLLSSGWTFPYLYIF